MLKKQIDYPLLPNISTHYKTVGYKYKWIYGKQNDTIIHKLGRFIGIMVILSVVPMDSKAAYGTHIHMVTSWLVRGIHWSLGGFPSQRASDMKLCYFLWCQFNSLWPSDAIWRHRSGSTLAQVMACCLTAPSHYLNQCWLIISQVHCHSL